MPTNQIFSVLCVVTVLVLWAAIAAESTSPQPSDATDGGNYTAIVHDFDLEEDIDITDENGTAVTFIIVFKVEGFKVIKPANRNVCLLKEMDNNSTCSDEIPVLGEVSPALRDLCTGKEIFVLKPSTCEENAEEGSVDGGRVKRSSATYGSCCRWHRNVDTHRPCCKRFIICTKKCDYVVTTIMWSKRCIYGCDKQF